MAALPNEKRAGHAKSGEGTRNAQCLSGRRSGSELEAEIDDGRRARGADEPRARLADRDARRPDARQGLRRVSPDIEPVVAEQGEAAGNGDGAGEAQEVAADRHVVVGEIDRIDARAPLEQACEPVAPRLYRGGSADDLLGGDAHPGLGEGRAEAVEPFGGAQIAAEIVPDIADPPIAPRDQMARADAAGLP